MKKETSVRLFKLIYTINSVIIIGSVFWSFLGNEPLLSLYYTLLLLSVSFCLSFLFINIWGIFINRGHSVVYVSLSLLLIVWIGWGLYLFFIKDMVFP